MKTMTGAGIAALALMLSACGGGDGNNASANLNQALPQIPAPNNGDWTQVVEQTPEGGFRMGNPNAPVKLIEYASMTCPHCAAFSEASSQRLKDVYVKSGQVSFEYRNFIIGGPLDAAASIGARCMGPSGFFGITEQLFAAQEQWAGAVDEQEMAQVQALPADQRVGALFRAADLDDFFRERGVPESQINQCLSNQQELDRLAQMTRQGAERYQIPGTPGFVINDELVQGVSDWEGLEPILRARIGG